MKYFIPFLTVLVLLTNFTLYSNTFDNYDNWNVWKVITTDRDIAREIARLTNVDIFDAAEDGIFVYADDQSIQIIKGYGLQVEYLRHRILPEVDEGYYHTWAQVLSEVESYVGSHSSIARCDTIGWSVQNRPIISIKISDNVNQDELEGKIQFNGCHHGDENISTEINLYFMRYILDNYGSISAITSLIDNREIFIIPVVNPDGFVAGTRRNAHSIDLNRNYGFQFFGYGGATHPFSEPESRAMRDDYIKYCYSISLDYHSVSEYVNYLWDYSYTTVPDYEEEVIMFAVPYADSSGYDTINGASWYVITGSCQDASYGLFGALDATIESLQPNDPDPECLRNLSAMLYVSKLSGYGIAGYVKDSISGEPLDAVVFFNEGSDRKWIMNTRKATGEYHKILYPGTYSITAFVPGYSPLTHTGQVYQDTFTSLDFNMVEENLFFAVRMCAARQDFIDYSSTTYAFDALGPQDGYFMSLDQEGYIILDMGEETPVTDLSGYDIFIYEGNDGQIENCEVYIGNSPETFDTWYLLGTAHGTDSFDISSSGLSEARYVRVVDDGSSTSGSTPGYDLDAVHSKGTTSSIEEPLVDYQKINVRLIENISNSGSTIQFHLPKSTEVSFSVFDLTGRMIFNVRDIYPPGQHSFIWSGNNNSGTSVNSGIYFLKLDFEGEMKTFKIEFLD